MELEPNKYEFIKEEAMVWAKVYPPGQNIIYKYRAANIDKVYKEDLKVKLEYEEIDEDEEDEEDFLGPVELNYKNLLPRSEFDENLVDLIDIRIFNEAELMNILKERFETDEIYTYCGSTLISVNPYDHFDGEYEVEKKEEYVKYLDNEYFVMKTLTPHLYSLAVASVHELRYDDVPDSKIAICLSGESGSGKTEAGCYMLQFIIYCYKKEFAMHSLESKIVNGHSILSAFGNARTIYNDNSSRFGKFINLFIDAEKNEISYYTTKTYLLEKNRVVDYLHGDRSFHIFYAIMKYLPDEIKQRCHFIDDFEEYNYLGDSVHFKTLMNDKLVYDGVLRTFDIFELSDEIVEAIWKLLAFVLAVGNLEYIMSDEEDGNDPCTLRESNFSEKICNILEVDHQTLEDIFSHRMTYVMGDGIKKILKYSECEERREAISKAVYHSVFYYLVTLQNDLSKKEKKKLYENVGILDIPGYEIFSVNSLDQLCINYANERAQQLFTEYYFREEKTLFEREGLGRYIQNIKSRTNEDILILIDHKRPNGVFQFLQSNTTATQVGGGGRKLLADLNNHLKENPLFNKKKIDRNKFSIKHSISWVEYTTDDFVLRNKDDIPMSLFDKIIENSPSMGAIIKPDYNVSKRTPKNLGIAAKFSQEMGSLIKELKNSRCNFVRCIKPNNHKMPEKWDQSLVINQMKFLGVEEFLEMKMKLYPVRIEYDDFCTQFLQLNGLINIHYDEYERETTDWRVLTQDTMEFLFGVISEDDVLYGKKKLFISSSQFSKLEKKLQQHEIVLNRHKDWMLRCYKAYQMRKAWVGFIKYCRKVKSHSESCLLTWKYKLIDYKKFSLGIDTLYKMQRDFKFKLMNRKRRLIIQKKIFQENWYKTLVTRRRFVLYRRAAIIIQRNFRVFKFLKKIRMAQAIREILYESYDTRFWGAILFNIQTRAAIRVQKHVRGMLCRKQYAFEVDLIKNFRKNYRQNKAATIIQKFMRGHHVRLLIGRLEYATILIQKNWRRNLHHKAYIGLREATIKIQRFWMRYSFRVHRYKKKLEEKIINGLYRDWNTTAKQEMKYVWSCNYVESIKPSTRISKFVKQDCNLSYLAPMKAFAPKKIRIYSYILDVDPIIDPNDTYQSTWAITFMIYFHKLREMYRGNLLHLSVGESHTMAVSDNSHVFHWGNSNLLQLAKFEPFMNCTPHELKSSLEPETLNFIQCGNNHNLLYSKINKKLYSYGNNERGQLGVGHYNQVKGIVDLSYMLKGRKVTQLETRCDTNAICLEDGSALVWPAVLGDRLSPEPYLFRSPNPRNKITNVSIGFDFLVYLSSVGKLYSMGRSNEYGELGVGDFEPRNEPTLITQLCVSGDIITQVSCGFKHVIAKNQSGKIFTWGWGERGQLGHETDRNLPFPRKVLFKRNSGFSYHAINIQAGYRSSYALLDGRRIFNWGTNGKIKKQLTPVEYTVDGQDEIYYKKTEFKPIKICTTWSKTLSVTYVILGDCRYLTDLSFSAKELLIKNIYNEWEHNYFDSKPSFDRKISPLLDLNMFMNQDRIRKIRRETQGLNDRLRKREQMKMEKRNGSSNFSKSAYRTTKKRRKRGQTDKSAVKRTKKKGIEKERSRSGSIEKENSDNNLNQTAKSKKSIEELKKIRLKLEKIKYHMKVILNKDPDTWTDDDIKFLEEAKNTFKEYEK